MSVDVLSDVLRSVRLTGAVYFDFLTSSPWVAEAPPSTEIASAVMPGAGRVIEYHLIAEGACWGHAVGDEPIRMRAGDMVVFPQGDPHVLSSGPGMRATPDLAAYARSSLPLPLVYELGGGGDDRARIVCGFLGLDDRPYNPLLAALPRMIHLSTADAPAQVGRLGHLLAMAVHEARHPRAGSDNVLARLSELLFVEAVRQYLDALPPTQQGWLAGVRDPIVGQALAALHESPADDWTVESLARRVGASRSVLAERFSQLLGQPPMQYLAMWRMQLAARLLAEGERVSAAARSVGYDSEAAFSRAFKKLVGVSPAAWRQPAGRSLSPAPD